MATDEEELLPCPICGSTVKLEDMESGDCHTYTVWRIRCTGDKVKSEMECLLEYAECWFNTKKEAIRNWNGQHKLKCPRTK